MALFRVIKKDETDELVPTEYVVLHIYNDKHIYNDNMLLASLKDGEIFYVSEAKFMSQFKFWGYVENDL